MIHFVHTRPTNMLKIFGPGSGQLQTFQAGSDAWGNYGSSEDGQPPQPPWGHSCRIPPGHYVLQNAVTFVTPIPKEGAGQIEILDIDDATLATLTNAGKAEKSTQNGTPSAIIGEINLPLGQFARFGHRDGLMIHAGGTNLGAHFDDPNQRLLRTYGCVRVHNANLPRLIAFVQQNAGDQTIVYSACGDPAPLPGY
jgi:hypothetical protein